MTTCWCRVDINEDPCAAARIVFCSLHAMADRLAKTLEARMLEHGMAHADQWLRCAECAHDRRLLTEVGR